MPLQNEENGKNKPIDGYTNISNFSTGFVWVPNLMVLLFHLDLFGTAYRNEKVDLIHQFVLYNLFGDGNSDNIVLIVDVEEVFVPSSKSIGEF